VCSWRLRLPTLNGVQLVYTSRVLHRDLKPANIGFDVRGDIKIFDLGLAKELKPSQRVGIDQYHTSGIAGKTDVY